MGGALKVLLIKNEGPSKGELEDPVFCSCSEKTHFISEQSNDSLIEENPYSDEELRIKN